MNRRKKVTTKFAIALVLACGLLTATKPLGTLAFAAPLSNVNLPANTMSDPSAIVVTQQFAWIPMFSNNTVVELNATTGKLVRVFTKIADKLSAPNSLGIEGTDLWVSNYSSGNASEVNFVNGMLVRTVRASDGCLKSPVQLLAGTSQVWVLSSAGQCLLKINPSSGAVMFEVHLRGGKVTPIAIYGPVSMVMTGNTMWVSEALPHSDRVVGLSASTGALLFTKTFGSSGPNSYFGRMAATSSKVYVTLASGDAVASFDSNGKGGSTRFSSSSYHFDGIRGLASTRSEVWAVSGTGGRVTEMRADDGRLVASYQLVDPARAALSSMAIAGDTAWVVNSLGSIIEFRTSNGRLIRTIK